MHLKCTGLFSVCVCATGVYGHKSSDDTNGPRRVHDLKQIFRDLVGPLEVRFAFIVRLVTDCIDAAPNSRHRFVAGTHSADTVFVVLTQVQNLLD